MESSPEAMVMMRLPMTEKGKRKKRIKYSVTIHDESDATEEEAPILTRLGMRVNINPVISPS